MVKSNFFDYLDFALQFAPAGPEEKEIRAKLASIGIGAGKTFDLKDLSLEHKAAVGLGMKAGEEKIEKYLATQQKSINGWKISSFFGNREFFKGDWLLRAAGAKAGIYGNDAEEACYAMTREDVAGELEFFDGVPIGETNDRVYDYLNRSRALGVYLDNVGAVSIYSVLAGMAEQGADAPNKIAIWEQMMD